MTKNAVEFLEGWRQSYIYAEARSLDQLDETVTECLIDARENGLSREDINKAANGDLRGYIQNAIAKASGE